MYDLSSASIPTRLCLLVLTLLVHVNAFCTDEGFPVAAIYNSNCYFASNTVIVWTACQTYCANNDGWMIDIHSQAENDWVEGTFKNVELGQTGDGMWIGARCDPTLGCNSPTMGTTRWYWENGSDLDYVNSNNAINGGAGEYMRFNGAQWQDADNTRSFHCACKKWDPSSSAARITPPTHLPVVNANQAATLSITIPQAAYSGIRFLVTAGSCPGGTTTITSSPLTFAGTPTFHTTRTLTVTSSIAGVNCSLGVALDTGYGDAGQYNLVGGTSTTVQFTVRHDVTRTLFSNPIPWNTESSPAITVDIQAVPDDDTITVTPVVSPYTHAVTFTPPSLTWTAGVSVGTTATFTLNSTEVTTLNVGYIISGLAGNYYRAPANHTAIIGPASVTISPLPLPVTTVGQTLGSPITVTLSTPPAQGPLTVNLSPITGVTLSPGSMTFDPGTASLSQSFTYTVQTSLPSLANQSLSWSLSGADAASYQFAAATSTSTTMAFASTVATSVTGTTLVPGVSNQTVTWTLLTDLASATTMTLTPSVGHLLVDPAGPVVLNPGVRSWTVTLAASPALSSVVGGVSLQWALSSLDFLLPTIGSVPKLVLRPPGGPVSLSLGGGGVYFSNVAIQGTFSVQYDPPESIALTLDPLASQQGLIMTPAVLYINKTETSKSMTLVAAQPGIYLLSFQVTGPNSGNYDAPTPFNITLGAQPSLSMALSVAAVFANETRTPWPVQVTVTIVNAPAPSVLAYDLTMAFGGSGGGGGVTTNTWKLATPNTTLTIPLTTIAPRYAHQLGAQSVTVTVSGAATQWMAVPTSLTWSVLPRNHLLVYPAPQPLRQWQLTLSANQPWHVRWQYNDAAYFDDQDTPPRILSVSCNDGLASIVPDHHFPIAVSTQSSINTTLPSLLPTWQGTASCRFITAGRYSYAFVDAAPVVRVEVGDGRPVLQRVSTNTPSVVVALLSGARVSLFGERLSNQTGVPVARVNGVACQETIPVSPTQIDCRIARGSGRPNTTISFDVIVNGLTSNILDTVYLYLDQPLLTPTQVTVSEDDSAALPVTLSVLVPPTATVSIAVALEVDSSNSDDTSDQVVITNSQLTIEPTGSTSATFSLRAQQDNRRDGDVNVTLTVATSSDDPFYHDSTSKITVYVLDANPRVLSLNPDYLPQIIGGVITVAGFNLVPSPRHIYLNNDSSLASIALDADADKDGSGPSGPTHTNGTISLLQQGPTSLSSTSQIVVKIPAGLSVGYYDMSVANEDPSRRGPALSQALLITDECPDVGFVGSGPSDCRPCPTGGICPGGNRIYPQAGYWSPGLFLGTVEPCTPKYRCPGCEPLDSRPSCYAGSAAFDGTGTSAGLAAGAGPDRPSFCPPGHTGRRCASCLPGYTEEFGACVQCPSTENQLSLIITDACVWILMAISIAFVEDRIVLSHVIQGFMALQEIAQIGQSISASMSRWLLDIYSILHLFSGDVSFLKPDCQGRVDFYAQYGISIAYPVAILLVFTLVLCVTWVVAHFRWRGDPVMHEYRHHHYRHRFVRMFQCWLFLMYITLTSIGFEGVICVKSQGQLVLAADLTVPCFQGRHIPVFISSVCLLLFVTVGYPLWYLFWIMRISRQLDQHDMALSERWDLLTEPFPPRYRHMYFMELFILFGLALGPAVLADHPVTQLAGTSLAFFVSLCLIVALRPFLQMWENALMSLLCIANILACTTVYLSLERDRDDITLKTVMYAAVASAVTLIIAYMALVVYTVFFRWRNHTKNYLESRAHQAKMKEQDTADFESYMDILIPSYSSDDDDLECYYKDGDGDPGAYGLGLFAMLGLGDDRASSQRQQQQDAIDSFADLLANLDDIHAEGQHDEDDDITCTVTVDMDGVEQSSGMKAAEVAASTRKRKQRVVPLHVRPELPIKAGDQEQGMSKRMMSSFAGLWATLTFSSPSAPVLETRAPPAYWTGHAGDGNMTSTCASPDQVVDVTATHLDAVQHLLYQTSKSEYIGRGRDNMDLKHTHLECVSVKLVVNHDLWLTFAARASTLSRTYAKRQLPRVNLATSELVLTTDDSTDSATPCIWPVPLELDNSINESMVFHGTSSSGLQAIPTTGFDERVSSTGMFGYGIYFAENASKADEYSVPDEDGLCHMFLCRALVGLPYTALESQPFLRRPPCLAGHTYGCPHPRFNSLLAETNATFPDAVLQKYRELVVYDRNAVYPEYIISYYRRGQQLPPDQGPAAGEGDSGSDIATPSPPALMTDHSDLQQSAATGIQEGGGEE